MLDRRARPRWWALVLVLAVVGAAASATADDAGVDELRVAPPPEIVDAGVAVVPPDAAAAPPDAAPAPRRVSIDAAVGRADAGVAATAIADAGLGLGDGDGGVPQDDGGAPLDDGGLGDAGLVDAGLPPGLTTALTAPPDAGVPDASVEDIVQSVAESPPDARTGAWFVIKLVLGLAALMVLAYLGGHRKVTRLQDRLGIGGVIAAGFPLIALGVIARQPEIGVLTPAVVEKLQPLLHFGLGWLGFIIGAQLDVRVLDRVPAGTAYLILVEALAPFAATAAACGGAMVLMGGADWHDDAFWRDIIILGTAAAMTAPRKFRGFANRTWREGRSVDHLLAQLDEIVGVIGLLFVAAYFRPDVTVGWQLPGTAWVFVSIGLGVVIGVLIFAMVRVPVSNAEFLAVVLGSIAFGAGLAGYLFLSPIVVCFLAGVLVTNFPCDQRESIFRILNHLERPIHLMFLIVAGATWDVFDGRAWALVPLFVVARIVGKWLGIFAAERTVGAQLPSGYADARALVTPLSVLAIALVINAQGLAGPATTWITTVVIGAAVLNEVLVSITSPARPVRATTPMPLIGVDVGAVPGAVDELDDLSEPTDVPLDHEAGPTYRDGDDEPDELPPMQPRPPTRGGGGSS